MPTRVLTKQECMGSELEDLIDKFAKDGEFTVFVFPDEMYRKIIKLEPDDLELPTVFRINGRKVKVRSDHQERWSNVLDRIAYGRNVDTEYNM